MARVPYLTQAEVSPQNQDLLTRNLNLYRALVHSPDTARTFAALGLHIRYHLKLDPRLREMAILQVGYLTRAPYEFSHHVEIGHTFGVTDADIQSIVAESRGETSALPPLDRAVLRAARELVAQPALSDEAYAALSTDLDHERIVELIVTISFYCGVVRILGALKIDVEPEYQHYLTEYPFPTT
ncbi:MAG: carboxymuconolactone decarboxylase family protein [Gammaproteobacteria bacterium]|nr:carboxymuconolactone decarboxylase family protein [Gammaproteobacteria bacterium]